MSNAERRITPLVDIEPTGVMADLQDPATQDILTVIEEQGGGIPYSQFMALSLYGKHGLYSSGSATINGNGLAQSLWGGGFETSASSYIFNETIAEHARAIDEALQSPSSMTILESGAGHGTTASDILSRMRRTAPDLYDRLLYRIIEPGALREKQEITIRGYNAGTASDNPVDIDGLRGEGDSDYNKVVWTRGSALDAVVDPFEGLIFSNEVPDALPIEVVRNKDGQSQQQFVGLQNGEWVKIWKQPTEQVLAYLSEYGIVVRPGCYETINLGAVEFQRNMGSMLKKGAMVTLDYGQFGQEHAEVLPIRFYPEHDAKRIGRDERLTYEQLSYRVPGRVDITAHVNFDPMCRRAEQDGFTVAFAGLQRNYLLTNGHPTEKVLKRAKIVPHKKIRYWQGEEEVQEIPLNLAEERLNSRLDTGIFTLGRSAMKALVLTKGVGFRYANREWRFPPPRRW